MSSGTRPYRVMIHHQNPIVRLEKEAFFPGIVGIGMGEALNSQRFLGEYVSPLGWETISTISSAFWAFFLIQESPVSSGVSGMSGKYCQNMPWCFVLRAPSESSSS